VASYQRIDFRPMVILIIGQTFVNLSPGQVWKAPLNVIDAGTVDDQTNHVVHPNPSALHNRLAPADIGHTELVKNSELDRAAERARA
jgi:hypothetical protein